MTLENVQTATETPVVETTPTETQAVKETSAEPSAPASAAQPTPTETQESLLGDVQREVEAPPSIVPDVPDTPKEEAEAPKEEPKKEQLLGDDGEGKPDPRLEEDNKDDIHWSVGLVDPEHEGYFGRYKTLNDALAAQMHLAKMQGKMVTIPDHLATDDEWGNFYNKIGRPKAPGEYTLDEKLVESLTEEGAERVSGFLTEMHNSGARQEQIDAAINWFQREEAAASAAEKAEQEQAHAAALERLKTEWPGTAYTTNINKAEKVLTTWLNTDDAKALANTPLGDGTVLGKSPDFIRFCYQVGLGMGEATSPIAAAGGINTQYTESEIDQMFADAYDNGDQALRQKAETALRALYERQGVNAQIGPGVNM